LKNYNERLIATKEEIITEEMFTKKITITIEQHKFDKSAGKQLSLSCHRCLINVGVEKMNNI